MKTRIYLFIYMSYANFFLLLKPAIGNKSLEKKLVFIGRLPVYFLLKSSGANRLVVKILGGCNKKLIRVDERSVN